MTRFKIGDLVECVVDHPTLNRRLYKGMTGVVVECCDGIDYIKVRWDLESPDRECFHACGGKCEPGYGYNVHPDEIIVVLSESASDVSDEELLKFLGVGGAYGV